MKPITHIYKIILVTHSLPLQVRIFSTTFYLRRKYLRKYVGGGDTPVKLWKDLRVPISWWYFWRDPRFFLPEES